MALGVFMLMMYAAVIYFAWYTGASAVIKRDQWHHLTMLTKYFNTGFDFHLLTFLHGEHLQLGYNAWFVLNGALFGLNTQLELFLGLFFLGGFIVLLFREFDASLKHNSAPLQRQLMFVLMLMIALSFHQIISFTYSLLSFGAFISVLLMMLFISVLNEYLMEKKAASSLVPIMVLVLFLLGVGFSGGGWMIYFGAAITVLCSWVVTHRPPKEKILMLGGGLLVLAAVMLWINSFEASGTLNTNSGVTYIVQHFDQAVIFMLILLTNSMLDINWFQKVGLLEWVYVIGCAIGALYLIGLYLFYKTRMWEKTYAPFYLIAYFWIFSLALLLYRFPVFGANGAAFPRYATALQLGLLGVLWIVIYWVRTLPRNKASVMWLVVGLAVGVPYLFNLYSAIQIAPFVRNANAQAADTVLYEKFDKKSEICPNEQLCRQGVITLKDHRLNIYRNRNELAQPIVIKFKKWGPQSTTKGVVPNALPNGYAGIWFQIDADPGLGKVQIYFDGKPVVTNFHDRIITASVPAELFNTSGKKKIVVRQVLTGKDFEVGEFVVLDKEEPIQLKDISIKFKRWSPQSTKRGIVPHAQSDGYAGLWFQLEADPGLGKVQIYFDGKPVATHSRGLIITAGIPVEQFNKPGTKKIVVRQVSTGRDFEVGEFVVLAD